MQQSEKTLWIKEERSRHQFSSILDILSLTRVRPIAVPTKPGNMTYLFYHLSRSHPLEYSSIKQPQPSTSACTGGTPHKRQQTTMERYSAAVPYDKPSKCYKEIRDAVAYHLVKDLLLPRTVEKSGYKNLIHVLDPPYILISNRLKKGINNYQY